MRESQTGKKAVASKPLEEAAMLGAGAVLERFATTEAGLSELEAANRLSQYGPNEVAREQHHTWWHRLWTEIGRAHV